MLEGKPGNWCYFGHVHHIHDWGQAWTPLYDVYFMAPKGKTLGQWWECMTEVGRNRYKVVCPD
jgi:hypothetical protein